MNKNKNKNKNILIRYSYTFVAVVFFIAGGLFLLNDSTRIIGLVYFPLAVIFLALQTTTSDKRNK